MDLPILTFLQERLNEADTSLETRKGSAFYDMFIKPHEFIVQPFVTAMDEIQTAQSIRRILALPDPDAFDEDLVDDVVANLYVFRDPGGIAEATVRAFYSEPVDKEYPALSAEVTSPAGSYFNTDDIRISKEDMSLQTDGTLFYMDFKVRAQAEGLAYNAEPDEINAFLNDPDCIRLTNLTPAEGGLPRETNTELLNRAHDSIAVRDLETTKGIIAILKEKFPFIRAIQSIGMGDPEMMRDILYNIHVGGKTDVYIKVPALTTASTDIIGLIYDTSREIARNLHGPMAKNSTDPLISPDTGTPNIAVGSVVVREDIVETAAFLETVPVPPGTGIDLSTTGWIRISVDGIPLKNIKISGANPSATQRFEIINSINAAMGYMVAIPTNGDKIRLQSMIIGSGSQITVDHLVSPISDALNASAVLFGISVVTLPKQIMGIAAAVFDETVDYLVDYPNGKIYQTDFDLGARVSLPTITSGQTMLSHVIDGQIILDTGVYYLQSSTANAFHQININTICDVRPGDEVTIHKINGVATGTVLGDLPQTFYVGEVKTTNKLFLTNFNPTGVTGLDEVEYSILSNQVVVTDYKYNPLSIDIGGQVLLADGRTRGVRPGRGDYTIQNTPFVDIVSIQEIDPDTLEVIGEPLVQHGGFGFGGFGEGGFGQGISGDYGFYVMKPVDRYSVFEDSMILFNDDALSRSFRVTYRWAPQLVAIHNLTRTDTERVTGADVLPKVFVPGFVDVEIGIRRDPTNLTTPSNERLSQIVADFINTKSGSVGVESSDITKILEDLGVESVKIPYTMTAKFLNTDGTFTIVESTDILKHPEVTLLKDTDNYVTPRITYFYPNNVSVVEVP